MKFGTFYFLFCGMVALWFAYAQYSGQVLWGTGGAARQYRGYQHK